jgi:hypothetical protein
MRRQQPQQEDSWDAVLGVPGVGFEDQVGWIWVENLGKSGSYIYIYNLYINLYKSVVPMVVGIPMDFSRSARLYVGRVNGGLGNGRI